MLRKEPPRNASIGMLSNLLRLDLQSIGYSRTTKCAVIADGDFTSRRADLIVNHESVLLRNATCLKLILVCQACAADSEIP